MIIHSVGFWLCFNLTNCLLLVLCTFSYIIFIIYFPRYSLDFMMNWIVWISCNLVFKLFDCVIFISWIIFMTTYDQLCCQRQCFILFYYLDFGGIGFWRFFEIYKHSFVKSDFCQDVWSENSNFSKNTFTWDPKWTQTGSRFHFRVKFSEVTSLSAFTWLPV